MDGLPPDVRSLWYQMKNQDKELQRKRRWLMGFSAPAGSSIKRLKSDGSMLPETILREDDLFYDNLKKHVEKGFGVCREATELSTTCIVEPFMQHKMVKNVLALLNDFTNHGLYVLAKVIGGSSNVFEQTRWKMKKFIKENMPKVLGKQCNTGKEAELYSKLRQILKDPRNFQKNHIPGSTLIANMTIRPTLQSHYDAIKIVLRGLKHMSLHTLCVMYRRLKGIKGSIPTLNSSRTSWNKARLVKHVKSLSLKMLSKLEKWDELPVPVMKAMEVARLSLKLSNHQNDSISYFCNYSPEIESLQNEIVKAISLLSCKVGVQELKGLKELLAPDSEYQVLNGGLRNAIKKMLTEFLFECSEMNEIPILLLDTLAVIKSCALRQKEVTEEVECILNVSAQVKQVLWDSVAYDDLYLEFSNAYMEDLEESDDGELFDYDDEEEEEKLSDISEVGSTADSHCVDSSRVYCTPIWDVNNMSTKKSESECKTEVKVEPDDFLFTPSVGLSKSFNHTTGMGSTLYQAEQSEHRADMKDSIPCFSLSSNPTYLKQEKKNCQRSCKVEPANFSEDFESNIHGGKTDAVSENPQGRNKYLAFQQACDETSLIAYRLIGQVLEGFARTEELDLDQSQLSYLNDGNSSAVDCQDSIPNEDQTASTDDVDTSIFIQAVQELIPSFPHSELEKVRKILR